MNPVSIGSLWYSVAITIVCCELLHSGFCRLYAKLFPQKPLKFPLLGLHHPVLYLPRMVIAVVSYTIGYGVWSYVNPALAAHRFAVPFVVPYTNGAASLSACTLAAMIVAIVVPVTDRWRAIKNRPLPRAWRARYGCLPASGSFNRFVVNGMTGSGKSTLAERITHVQRHAPDAPASLFVELDAYYWKPNWTPHTAEGFVKDVSDALVGAARKYANQRLEYDDTPIAPAAPSKPLTPDAVAGTQWVVAGNYQSVRHLIWGAPDPALNGNASAQCILWLDYPLRVVLYRLIRRIIVRGYTRDPLWPGNSNFETGWIHLRVWSEQSLLWWLFRYYWVRRVEINELTRVPEYRHLHVIRFDRPADADRWLTLFKERESKKQFK